MRTDLMEDEHSMAFLKEFREQATERIEFLLSVTRVQSTEIEDSRVKRSSLHAAAFYEEAAAFEGYFCVPIGVRLTGALR